MKNKENSEWKCVCLEFAAADVVRAAINTEIEYIYILTGSDQLVNSGVACSKIFPLAYDFSTFYQSIFLSVYLLNILTGSNQLVNSCVAFICV